MATTPTDDQINLVQRLLPSEALQSVEDGGYGWDSDFISLVMSENSWTPTEAVRFFWLQRVNETSEYLDLTGKPLTDIHKQAKEMLDYWDNILRMYGVNSTGPAIGRKPLTFGNIERPESYERIDEYWTGVRN